MRQHPSTRVVSAQIKLAKIMALVPVDRAPILPRGAQRPRGQQLRSPAGADRLPEQPVGVHLRAPSPAVASTQSSASDHCPAQQKGPRERSVSAQQHHSHS